MTSIARRIPWLKLNPYRLFDYYYFNNRIGYSFHWDPQRIYVAKDLTHPYYGFMRRMMIRRLFWSKRCNNE